MTTTNERHTPTPEFRASLENEIVRTLRSETQFAPSIQSRRNGRFKQVAILAIGLVLGAGTQIATAQVQDARSRSQLESAQMLGRTIAGMRLTVARENHERTRAGYEAGTLSQESLHAAASDLRAAELVVARTDIDLEEIRASSSAPRNELWAPVVGGRDFVRDRLRLDAALAQERLKKAEGAAAESERKARAGLVTPAALDEARLEVAKALREFKVIATKLTLREEFLKDRLEPAEVTRRAMRFELMFDLELAQQRMQFANSRLKDVRELFDVGMTTLLSVKRAEVDVLERTIELNRLSEQLGRVK